DYQCPYCNRHFLQTMPTIMSEMIEAGRVQYVFKDFPLDQIHPDARDAAQAARCAGEQEAYWEMHDQLFNTQTVWGGQANLETIFTGYAGELGLDEAEFASCYASNSYAEAVQTNYDEGVQLGVTGTPAFFINGYFISGARPYELFELIVDAIETNTLEDLYREAYDQQVEAYKQQLAQEQAQAERANTPIDVPINESPAIGSPDAPITIIEYTDFQCPYCSRHFSETFPQIKENYIDKGLVRYVFKDFPLSFHPQAQLASEAARCADDQEAFLAMHNQLFASQSEWGNNGARDVFVGYAGELGLDVDSFTTCLDSGKYTEIVKADLNEGAGIGITGTPSFVVNGQLVVGALPYSTFDQAFQGILEQNNSN
ncbi:MAG: DsbA family protein, partial [Anaerolineales bacterium]|nr:DsbA family protein [Anaerolineales bacterium]